MAAGVLKLPFSGLVYQIISLIFDDNGECSTVSIVEYIN